MVNQNIPRLTTGNQPGLIELQHELPDMLLNALERRWYDRLDIARAKLEPLRLHHRADSHFLSITGLARGSVENNLAILNMQNVISSFRDGSHSLIYLLRGTAQGATLDMGVRRINQVGSVSTQEYARTLANAIRGNFPHADLTDENAKTIPNRSLDHLTEVAFLAGITGIPSEKHQDTPHFTQTVDRLINALQGQEYTILVLAEPMIEGVIAQAMESCRQLAEEIHTIARRSRSESINQSTSMSRGKSQSSNLSLGSGSLIGMVLNLSAGQSRATSRGMLVGQSRGYADSFETLDKTAEYCERLLNDYLERMQAGRNLGFWNVGLFLGTDDRGTFFQAQGIIRGLYSGEDTRFEPLRLIDLSTHQEARDSIRLLVNPALSRDTLYSPLGYEFQSLGTPLTTNELSILMNLPQAEVPGIRIKQAANFNVNPSLQQGFRLGSVVHLGKALPTSVHITPGTLQRHTLVTGLTGSGKTNTCMNLLLELYKNQQIGFLVIDPAKTEYRVLMQDPALQAEMSLFTLGDETDSPFRLNPFEFVPGFPLLTHIDLLKSVFNAAFPMQGPLGYLLEEAIVELYEERGWDIALSRNRFLMPDRVEMERHLYLPRLHDLFNKIDRLVAEKKYSGQITQDITAALKVRLGSLLTGGKGRMLNAQRSIPIEQLLRRPVLLELRRMGDDDEKALVMGLLFVQLYEACHNRSLQSSLQHVTLIEEAHRLLRNVATQQSIEYSNPRGKAVEMFADMMAELRAYGEGFIIVDQMPKKLIPDAIKGSNLKIIHRLVSAEDRSVVGEAIGLKAEQIDHLARLQTGQAVVHAEDLGEACLTAVRFVEAELSSTNKIPGSIDLSAPSSIGSTNFAEIPVAQVDDLSYSSAYRLDPQLIRLGTDFLTALLTVAGFDHLNATIGWMKLALNHHLAGKGIQDVNPTHLESTRKSFVRQVATDFYSFHSSADDWQARIELEELLQVLLRSDVSHNEVLTRLTTLVAERIAVSPRQFRLGCSQCAAMCLFGHHFQQPGNYAVELFKNQLGTAMPGQRPELSKVQDLALKTYPHPVRRGLQLAATYCLAVQSTDAPDILTRFHRAAFSTSQ